MFYPYGIYMYGIIANYVVTQFTKCTDQCSDLEKFDTTPELSNFSTILIQIFCGD